MFYIFIFCHLHLGHLVLTISQVVRNKKNQFCLCISSWKILSLLLKVSVLLPWWTQ